MKNTKIMKTAPRVKANSYSHTEARSTRGNNTKIRSYEEQKVRKYSAKRRNKFWDKIYLGMAFILTA